MVGGPPSRSALRRDTPSLTALQRVSLGCLQRRSSRASQASEGVRKGGVEPPKPFGYRILSPARLPVPPLSHGWPRLARDHWRVCGDHLEPRVTAARCAIVRWSVDAGWSRIDVGNQILLDRAPAGGVAVDCPPRRHPPRPQARPAAPRRSHRITPRSRSAVELLSRTWQRRAASSTTRCCSVLLSRRIEAG